MKKYSIILFAGLLLFSSCKDSADDTAASKATVVSGFGITYSFYASTSSSQPWATISGEEGTVLPSVSTPKKNGYRFLGWKDSDGSTPPATFGADKIDFYAQWVKSSESGTTTLIGTKSAADTLYDIVFSDGSAMPYPDNLDDLTDEQVKEMVAMIFTTTYNPSNGQNTAGGQYQYKLGAGLVVADEKKWVRSLFTKTISPSPDRKGTSDDKEEYMAYTYNDTCFNMIAIGYAVDTNTNADTALSSKSLSECFGRQNYVDSSVFRMYAAYCPAFEYAINYGRDQGVDSSIRSDWYLPSVKEMLVLFENPESKTKYTLLVAKKYASLANKEGFKPGIFRDDTFWTSSSDSSQGPSSDTNYVATLYNDDWERSGYYGETNDQASNSTTTKYRIWIFDPYTGIERTNFMVNIGKVYKSEDEVAYWDDDEWNTEKGYAYKYNLYTQAYIVTTSAEKSFMSKSSAYSVIPMHVF